jgi:hypothetical protein
MALRWAFVADKLISKDATMNNEDVMSNLKYSIILNSAAKITFLWHLFVSTTKPTVACLNQQVLC